MRTINKQGSHVGSERVAAITVRQALKSLGVKESTLISGDRHQSMASASAASLAIRLPDFADAISRHALQSSNDAVAGLPAVDVDEAGMPLIEHSAAISYISSCLPDRRLIYVSPQIGSLGFAQEDLLDRPDLRLTQVHEDDLGRFEKIFRHSTNTAEKFSCHYRMYDSHGKVRWFHDEGRVVCDESGMPLFIRGVMLDISDKKQMEAELVDHRYYLERNVEQRTRELLRRIEMLESCNASLCDRLSSARLENAMLKQQLETEQEGATESDAETFAESMPGAFPDLSFCRDERG